MGSQPALLVVVLILFGNWGPYSLAVVVVGRRGTMSDLRSNKLGPSCTNMSCNIPAVEDKRGVPLALIRYTTGNKYKLI
ncbi:hypothetical protein PanWU01x14_003710 [Parasponia andersonii]|uniref:Uncharacterized protein n=1 Tax=Parasponia andersonii TaxID=3476 RepID=A0A2P5E5J6_PARAD|nr:hypothetical protein PanWU01x14_003710 [Parasponia andersonii]